MSNLLGTRGGLMTKAEQTYLEVRAAQWGGVLGGLGGMVVGGMSTMLPGAGALIAIAPITILLSIAGVLTGGVLGVLIGAGILKSKTTLNQGRLSRGKLAMTGL